MKISLLLPFLLALTISAAEKPATQNHRGCVTPPAGLVGWWRGEGNPLDEAGGNPGRPARDVTFGPGRVGQGFVFRHNGDAIFLGNPASLQLQNFSIEAWIKRSSTSTEGTDGNGCQMILAHGQNGFGFHLDPSGRPALTKVGVDNVTAGSIIADTNFHHLAVTKSGSAVVFYIDGAAYSAPAYDPGFVFTSEAAIGIRGDNVGNTFRGTIDDLAVYNRALSAREIRSIYNAGSAGKCTGSPNLTLEDFKLVGDLSGDQAAFTLNATVLVEGASGGSLDLLSGTVAITELGAHPRWNLRAEPNRFVLDFDHPGKYPIQIKFNAAVQDRDGWKTLDFRVAQSPLQLVVLKGLPADTQLEFTGAARPERKGGDFVSHLPSDGVFKLAWKQEAAESKGKLFYSGEMLSQISVSPGLMRQVALLNFKVMQGELNKITLLLHGAGEVTRVQGDQVLAWKVEPGTNGAERNLVVQLNQPQKDQFALQVQMQTPLGAFPQSVDVPQIKPDGATRFAGYFRIANEGAVRLEVTQATGLSQISPEQFPETDLAKALKPSGTQRFAYRFSGGSFALRIQADQVLPELNVSQVLAYRLGENEQAIDAEIELDIREAPLRELVLRIPLGYAVAKLNASGLSDYFTHDSDDGTNAEVRLVYGQPISGRQVVQLRLERNKALGETLWALPRIDIPKAKSVRGNIGIAADAGLRLTAERTQGLTEVATAFFPAKVAGLQAAFRLSDPAWQASVRIERIPQTIQVDGFHLFSIGEGIAYGSSLMNYVVSGSPVSAFKIELSAEYYNVEFSGKDIRTWQKTDGGYLVQLHTPISGAYTLLATYERPFKAQGETLAFTGARPLDALSEQGHTLIISAYQFQVKPVELSSGLLPIETAEVPAEYRLFFDAPILAAYRYTTRPFNLRLALSPLAQGDSVSQVVDRASVTNHISKEGQVVTDARYFLKNRGNPHFRISLPQGTQLWSALVNGAPVVPVMDGTANLIPLPQRGDPNAVLTVDLKLASRSKDPKHLVLNAPIVDAPVLLAEWTLDPDTNQRLVYRKGSLTPIGGPSDVSGFAAIARMFSGEEAARARNVTVLALILFGSALIFWRWAIQRGSYKFSTRHILGSLLGIACLVAVFVAFLNLQDLAEQQTTALPRQLAFLAPVQQASSALELEVSNLPEKGSVFTFLAYAWPALIGVPLLIFAALRRMSSLRIVGWLMIAWAALRAPNGAPTFLVVLLVFLLVETIVPLLIRLWRLPRQSGTQPASAAGAAPAVTLLFLLGLASWCCGCAGLSGGAGTSSHPMTATNEAATPESVFQEIRIEEKFALATAKIRWPAEKGQTLPLLFDPAVLTHLTYASNALKLVQGDFHGKRAQQLVAQKPGVFDIEARYEIQVPKRNQESGFNLPVQFGLVNRLKVTVANSDVDVFSPQAVSVQRETVGSNTVANVVLSPGSGVWLGWKPRSRDVKHEQPIFYAEVSQLYVPAAGVIEGAHFVSIRPAQGELSELTLDVPTGATVIDVIGVGSDGKSVVSLWRFDPDTRKLRISFNNAQYRSLSLTIRSQVPSGPLPFEQRVGLLTVDGAAGQVGLLGFATGNEVQLDSVNADGLSPINLEDFPPETTATLQSQIPGLTVRRAFRYVDSKAITAIKASPVEADVRVETQDTLSLGEDRTVLAVDAGVTISRAGIFRLSFLLPDGFDVETISGPALSHWTELKTGAGRVITMHLNGKTEGAQRFSISLAGSGIKATNAWPAPQLIVREASKQRGTLLIVPEQGMRLQAGKREGLTQLDPQKAGIRQKGVLSFRVLQTPWSLALDIEQVDPWIQVTSLQHALINEAQVKVTANLQYQIENTGLKAFRLFIPTNAEGVRFQGEQVADFLKVPGALTNAFQQWEVKLHRRMIGTYLLRGSYQIPLPDKARDTVLKGLIAADVNSQRGFVTVQSGGRLQVSLDAIPETLQATEWQSIPRALQQDIQGLAANFAFRLVDPAFQLPLRLERHDAAKLLPARVNDITFNSVISDDGVMLTHARLQMLPGDKRLLNLTLPKNARFWFAFVNQNGVWPWREQDRILIPLEQQTKNNQPIPVEIFYSSRVGPAGGRALNLELLAPKFDLPLENITWRVSMSDKWKLKHWSGSLELLNVESLAAGMDWQGYLQKEAVLQHERTKEAEEFMATGNAALQQGEPLQARRSFQSAYGLSGHDAAFNEDARVQLHNIKLQQALVGLNVRQAAAAGDTTVLGGRLRDLHGRKEVNYTQQDAKDIIDRNTADDNTAFMRLAERIVQQQDAALTSPAALRASIPEQGRVLTFKRSVVVDRLIDGTEDMKLSLQMRAVTAASWGVRILILLGTLGILAASGWARKRINA